MSTRYCWTTRTTSLPTAPPPSRIGCAARCSRRERPRRRGSLGAPKPRIPCAPARTRRRARRRGFLGCANGRPCPPLGARKGGAGRQRTAPPPCWVGRQVLRHDGDWPRRRAYVGFRGPLVAARRRGLAAKAVFRRCRRRHSSTAKGRRSPGDRRSAQVDTEVSGERPAAWRGVGAPSRRRPSESAADGVRSDWSTRWGSLPKCALKRSSETPGWGSL